MATWVCATCGPVPAGTIRHLDHNSPHGHETHECGSSAGLDWTKTKEHKMTTERAYFNVLDAAEGRNPWSKTPPGATTAPKPYESDACWVSGHEDCADSLCLCQCHKTQTWDPWNEAWKPTEPAAANGPGGQPCSECEMGGMTCLDELNRTGTRCCSACGLADVHGVASPEPAPAS